MKRKMNKRIFLAGLICFSIVTLFQSYRTEPGDIEDVTLNTIAYASGEEGEEGSNPDDPIIKPLGFLEWVESIMDNIGL